MTIANQPNFDQSSHLLSVNEKYDNFKNNLKYLENNELYRTKTNIDLLIDPSISRIKANINK